MKTLLKVVLVALAAVFLLLGCKTTGDDTDQPWTQPEEWETNRLPGVGF